MKTIILIAGLIFAGGLPAQHSPPDTTVAKKVHEKKKENRHHAIHSGAIVLIFVCYMFWFIRNESK